MRQHNRPLTYDEKKAAEAAFKGLPFNPKWSEAAQKVYLGLFLAMGNKRSEVFNEDRLSPATTIIMGAAPESKQVPEIICREQP